MKLKACTYLILALVVSALLPFVSFTQSVNAGGGIVLRPPFNRTYRVTAYFDHDEPSYAAGADGYIQIYNGERVLSSYANKTGEPYPYDGHDGWDWSMNEWTDILAAAAGEVVVSEDDWRGYGHTIVIAHDNNHYTQYSHLRQRLVQEGIQVTDGQHIAESGSSGTPHAHLHFGVRHGGYLNTSYATDPFGWRGDQRDPLFDYNGKESACLWGGLPGDAMSCADIIVEDDGAGWVQSPAQDGDGVDDWARYERGNGYRQHWAYNSYPGSTGRVEWCPPIRHEGFYRVYAFIPADNSTTTHAYYEVPYGSNGAINQSVNKNWVLLGHHWIKPGTYYLSLSNYTGEANRTRRIAADSMKFSASIIYLPRVTNWNGVVSSIVIRGNTSYRRVAISYYNRNGGLVRPVAYEDVQGNGVTLVTPTQGFDGSAVVVANGDVAVMVRNTLANGVTTYTGVPVVSSGAGWDQPGTTVYIPAALNQWGWVSTLYLQNTGVAVATADIRFYDINGNCQHTLEDVSIAPNGQAAVNLAGIAQLGSFSGSAVVSADQALAVTVRQDNANGAGYSDYNAFSSGADTLYLPSLLKGYYNWNSAFQVQNVGDIAAHVTITYSNGLTRTLLLPVPAKGYAMVSQSTEAGLPNNWAGSAWLSTNNGQPIVAIVNQQNTATGRRSHQSYSALLGGAASLVAPFVANNLGGDGWKTGLQVQNVDSAAAQVQRSYYYAGGSAAVGGGTENIDPGACAVYAADGMPVGAELSASVVSLNGQRIGGICNLSRSSGAGDIGGSYNLPGH